MKTKDIELTKARALIVHDLMSKGWKLEINPKGFLVAEKVVAEKDSRKWLIKVVPREVLCQND